MFRLKQIALVTALLASATFSAQGTDVLLRRSDVGGFVPVEFRARMTLQQEQEDATSEIELWRSGPNRTLVRLLDPKERGKYLLRLDADLWFLSPGTKSPVRLDPTHRVYGAATIDVLLGLQLSDDYQIAGTTSQQDPRGSLVVFDLKAKAERLQFPSVRYAVDPATELPVSALYRLQSGRAATLIEFFEWSRGERDKRYAKRIRVLDLLRKGALTHIEVVEFEERAVPDGLFDLGDSSERRALEGRDPPDP